MKAKSSEMAKLPSVQKILENLGDPTQIPKHEILTVLARQSLENMRRWITAGELNFKDQSEALTYTLEDIDRQVDRLSRLPLKKVINATGVVLHTGLGRAPYGRPILQELIQLLDGYVALEFDLNSGERGERLDLTDEMLRLITGAESSAVVNNNAAAVLIALNSLAEGREVIVSRGELIEIGGSFRLPDVMGKSGARMVEIGTTNRTHLRDYQNAISAETGAILLAHTSNYRIEGFTASPDKQAIIELAHKHGIPVIMDLGSGALFPTTEAGLPQETVVSEVVGMGFDVLTFSGDKLLGGPQAGIIVGKENRIAKIRRNPLMRVVRCDKTIFALLALTLRRYLFNDNIHELETYRLLLSPTEQLRLRADWIVAQMPEEARQKLAVRIEKSLTEAGSGSMPAETIESVALVMNPGIISESRLAELFRQSDPPVIGYRRNGEFYLDLKAICPEEDDILVQAIIKISEKL